MPKERDPSGRFVKTPGDEAQAEPELELESVEPGNLAHLLAAVGWGRAHRTAHQAAGSKLFSQVS